MHYTFMLGSMVFAVVFGSVMLVLARREARSYASFFMKEHRAKREALEIRIADSKEKLKVLDERMNGLIKKLEEGWKRMGL